MPPVPNEGDLLPPIQLVSKEPPDIENLLKLNPRIKPHANAVPSAVTKKVSVISNSKHINLTKICPMQHKYIIF